MNYIVPELYNGCYIEWGFYKTVQGEAPPIIPVPTTYFVLQIPNEKNPIDEDISTGLFDNTLWLDNKKWDDDHYYYDTWNVEA